MATDALIELSKLFLIEHGNKLDMNKMTPCSPGAKGAVAFVGRSGERNGIVGYVERFARITPYERGLITVALGGAALSSFVQPRCFYTGQNVDVLRP